MKTSKILSVILLLISISIVGLTALSTPVATVLAVEMTSDPTVHEAATILEQKAGVHIVRYGSLEYSLLIHRTFNTVFWISHGNDEGLEIQGHVKPWSYAKELVQTTLGKDIVLACRSNNLLKYGVSSSEAITFTGDIDAPLSALILSYLMTNNEDIVHQINSRLTEIAADPSNIKPLYLSTTELLWHAITFTITTVMVIIKFKLSNSQAQAVVNTGDKQGFLDKVKAVVVTFMENHPTAVKVGKILSAAWSLLSKLLNWLNSLSWWEKALWAAAIIANVIAIIASGSSALWATIVYAIASYTAWAIPFIMDWNDADGVVG